MRYRACQHDGLLEGDLGLSPASPTPKVGFCRPPFISRLYRPASKETTWTPLFWPLSVTFSPKKKLRRATVHRSTVNIRSELRVTT